MEPELLADKLKEMYFNSDEGETAVSIHLFGIKYAAEIMECGASPKQLAKLAGVPETYGTEINKGRNLAKYVKLK
ncbi:MAG: hypothetical protein KZQ93_18420 [Candidatus Thiodiazotropha sp. (ex Monitilora ramsayi)]|nr:hypothetical protein [Candidatus Thiodiazotropha sp. (ex Monitilora ramsayi)]